ncbi:MAG: hypothetical protein RR285_15765, partial [Acinetobacter sp.]
ALVEAKDIKAAGVKSYLTEIENQDATFGKKATRFNEKDTTRRLTFVAGGIDDTDAVNVAQLKVLDGKITIVESNMQNLSAGSGSGVSTEMQMQL